MGLTFNSPKPKTYFAIMAGQSNAAGTTGNGVNNHFYNGKSDPSTIVDKRLWVLNRDNTLTRATAAMSGNQADNLKSTWGARLAGLMIQGGQFQVNGQTILFGENDRLIFVNVSVGATGLSNNRWTPDGDLWLEVVSKIRFLTQEFEALPVGFFWAQGEADTAAPFNSLLSGGTVYRFWLDSFVYNVRDVMADALLSIDNNTSYAIADKVPFVTFRLLPSFVSGDPTNRTVIDSALRFIRDRVPYTASIDLTGLPANNSITDNVHFNAQQRDFMATAFYNAWGTAKTVSGTAFPAERVLKANGEYVIMRETSAVAYTNKWLSLISGTSSSDSQYSRINEFNSYRNSRGTYKFKAEFLVSGVWKTMVVEQRFSPLAFSGKEINAVVLSCDYEFGSQVIGSIPGLVYINSDNANGIATLFSVASGASGASQTWYCPFGRSNSILQIPVSQPITGGANVVATDSKLTMIMD